MSVIMSRTQCIVRFFAGITLEDNTVLRNRLQKKAVPTREYFEVEVADGISKNDLFILVVHWDNM